MRVTSFFNTTQSEIDGKRWNPYLGISINNKVFTVEYLFAYMDWATERAKERAAILIVDTIQHINNQVFDRSKPISAIEKAFRKADAIRSICEQAQSKLSDEKREKLIILDWTEIVYDDYFQHNLAIVKEAYAHNAVFREALLSITKRNLGTILNRLDEEQIAMLNQYLVNELPELITGFRHGGIHYNLNVYPGRIASIYAELLELDFFREIHSRLRLIGTIASVEAYL
jgi:tRNA-dependent cyclodipeptide synthase